VHSLFLVIMRALTHVFGYEGALEFKDIFNGLTGALIGCIILGYLFSGFYLDADIDKELPEDTTIQRVNTNPLAFSTNPKTRLQVMESFVGSLRIRKTKEKSILKKDSRRFTIIIAVAFVILLLFEWVLIAYDYFPGQ